MASPKNHAAVDNAPIPQGLEEAYESLDAALSGPSETQVGADVDSILSFLDHSAEAEIAGLLASSGAVVIDPTKVATEMCREAAEKRHRAAERFVDSFPNEAKVELARRAGRVLELTAPGSLFESRREEALRCGCGNPSVGTRASSAILKLRKSPAVCCLREEVDEIRQWIVQILEDPELTLSDEQRTVFMQWERVCRIIQSETEPLEVDGCWWLSRLFVRESPEVILESCDPNAVAIESVLGGYRWTSVLSAAASLMEWVRHHSVMPNGSVAGRFDSGPVAACVGGKPEATQVRKQPKRSTGRGEAQEKLAAALLKHHRYQNGSALNHEPIGNNELARLADVDKASATKFFRKRFKGLLAYKRACTNVASLIGSLQLVAGDIQPHALLGDRAGAVPADSDSDVD